MERDKIVDLINRYWKFDNYQQPQSSWHDKNSLIEAIDLEFEKNKLGKEFVKQIIQLFNDTFKTKYVWNAYRQRMILARVREGKSMKPPVSPDTFRAVFEHRKHLWEKDPEMSRHLVPETLCAQKHFFKYLDIARQDKAWRRLYIKKYHENKVTPEPDHGSLSDHGAY